MDKETRNFSIIAHIDHGKSTLADRMIEITNAVESRDMKNQFLDQMDIERERGITIKMQPVTLFYGKYRLNIIDTPGHIDFSYEVSRAMQAIEGCVLLVDATQGIQAQTLSVLSVAKELGIKIIPVLSKVDSPIAMIENVEKEIINLLSCSKEDIIRTSGKTGEGVEDLLKRIIEVVPPPAEKQKEDLVSLVFDSHYSNHTGIVLNVRVFNGELRKGDLVILPGTGEQFKVKEIGIFCPHKKQVDVLKAGDIGYVTTGIKKPDVAVVGDTLLVKGSNIEPLPGYKKPIPVIWASIYPEGQEQLGLLTSALEKLHLEDVSFGYEEESSLVLGKGFRCSFFRNVTSRSND